ncbi:hypothetical protein [Chamaesiphon sp. VAR_48_metabat_135_sub]|uniref:hypothetical protein n=1 Tax=Chamaesiphon sp. VAR_48_metabat_135_sub TaxID=2964699 RepID=UPI00286A3642|nr:hypothetical protein [Chamaesiphon sp. VAR_48_metabat_135_sub]
MADINHISVGAADPLADRALDLTAEELALIGYFAQGQKHSIANQKLKLEYTETSIRLNDRNGKLIGISKQVNEWQRKVLISNNSVYRAITIEMLAKSGFITKQKSSHPEFTEHHYYRTPKGYKLNHTEVIELWKIWWHNKRYQLNVPTPPIDVLIFSKGNWALVRDLQPKHDNFVLRTDKKEITIDSEEYIVWLDLALNNRSGESDLTDKQSEIKLVMADRRSSLPKQQIGSSNPSTQLNPSLKSADNVSIKNIGSQVKPMTQLESTIDRQSLDNINHNSLLHRGYINELPELEEEIDLEAYLSTFNTEDTEDVDRIESIYHISELLGSDRILDDVTPPPPPRRPVNLPSPATVTPDAPATQHDPDPAISSVVTPAQLSILQRQELLKLKAMNVLAKYLKEGDRIVRTEVLKNAQGQEIDRKVTKIQRGCPSWAIEQIGKVES